jgi:hypothetical protein
VAPSSIASGIRSSHTTPSILISASRKVRSAATPCGGIIASAARRSRDRSANARFTTGVGGIRGGRCSSVGMRSLSRTTHPDAHSTPAPLALTSGPVPPGVPVRDAPERAHRTSRSEEQTERRTALTCARWRPERAIGARGRCSVVAAPCGHCLRGCASCLVCSDRGEYFAYFHRVDGDTLGGIRHRRLAYTERGCCRRASSSVSKTTMATPRPP